MLDLMGASLRGYGEAAESIVGWLEGCSRGQGAAQGAAGGSNVDDPLSRMCNRHRLKMESQAAGVGISATRANAHTHTSSASSHNRSNIDGEAITRTGHLTHNTAYFSFNVPSFSTRQHGMQTKVGRRIQPQAPYEPTRYIRGERRDAVQYMQCGCATELRWRPL